MVNRSRGVVRERDQGTSSYSSDGQFFRSGKCGAGAGEINARCGVDPGFSFYTYVSDQHGPYHAKVISAAAREAPYILGGLFHHGSGLEIGTHYTDTGGATDDVFALCHMLGYRFCPRLRDFPDRRFASFEPASLYPSLKPLMGGRVKAGPHRVLRRFPVGPGRRNAARPARAQPW